MKAVFKYELDNLPVSHVHMPEDAKILSLQVQREALCLWAEVEVNLDWIHVRPLRDRSFRFVATGEAFDERGLRYIGTVQMKCRDGLVFHVYEQGVPEDDT